MQRALLFLFAIIFGGFVIAGVVDLSRGARSGWLYLLGAGTMIVLLGLSWRRVAELMRKRPPDA